MNTQDFIEELCRYWAKTAENKAVTKSITERIAPASPAARKAIMEKLKEILPPNRTVGVSDIYKAAAESGSALKTHEIASFEVVCDCCSSTYRYLQGTYDRCPTCGLAYYDTYAFKQYQKKNSVSKEYQQYYDSLLKDARWVMEHGQTIKREVDNG